MARSFLALAVLILAACAKPEVTPPAEPPPPASAPVAFVRMDIEKADRACRLDKECVRVGVACSCDCGEGANKKFAEKYRVKMSEMCRKHPPQIMCKMKCGGHVKCQDSLCTYVD